MTLLSRIIKRKPQGEVSFPPVRREKTREKGRYEIWINNHRWNKRVEAWCKNQLEKFTYRPTVGILMQCAGPKEELLQESLATIFHQAYPVSELSIVDRGSPDPGIRALLQEVGKDPRVKISYQKAAARDIEAIAKIMKKAEAEWILLMGAEDLLEPNALYNMVATLQDTVEIDFVFSDSDMIDDQGLRFDPQFKPVWAVGAAYPLGYYQHPVLLSRRLVEKLKGYERVSYLMEEGILLDEASNHSRYVLKAPGILYHARSRGRKNEKPPEPVNNVLMNENLVVANGVIQIDTSARQCSEPKVPLKILWAIDSLEQDDGELVWFHYLRYLAAESRHQFEVVSLKDGPMRANYERISRVHIASQDQKVISECVGRLHSEFQFDVAFVSSVENYWFPEILPRLEIPTLWHLYPGKLAEEARISEDLRQKFQFPATIIFLNSEIERTYKHFDTRDVSRILPTGVDLAGIKTFKQQNSPFDWRAKLGIKQSSVVFLCAGATTVRKGQHTFAKAALEVLSRNPEREIDFIIAGIRRGAYADELLQMIEKSGKMQHFHLFPETNDPFQFYPYYLIADVCVSCSQEETFPLTTLEAMAMKKAVIGTDVFSTNEVIQHEDNGYLVPPGDAARLAENLDLLVKQPESRDFFGRRSLEVIYEKFQFRKVVSRVDDLLRETIVYV